MHIELKAKKFVTLGKVSPGSGILRVYLQLVEFELCLLAYLYKVDLILNRVRLYKSFDIGWGRDDVYLLNEKFRLRIDRLGTKVCLIKLLIRHENDETRTTRQVVFLLL